jgi:glutamate/aspartate transport system substrate-binding protein
MYRVVLTVLALACAIDAASAQALEGRLKQIAETGIVKIGHRSDANPFSFLNPQREPDGYTVDLCKFVVRSLEQQLDAKLTIAWVPVDTQTRFDAVASGLPATSCC